MTDFERFAAEIRHLHAALLALRPVADAVGVAPPTEQEWFELLERKLIAQLDLPPVLVVAVVGGTNIGKSVLFNQLAGEEASASSPLAAGTRHPVCLAPASLLDESSTSDANADHGATSRNTAGDPPLFASVPRWPPVLARLFEPFELHRWRAATDPLDETPENRLFWRGGCHLPERLLLLDAPDIDSDVEVNWDRARAIRQSADVLLAVLTQQKYNDAAVKRFFRAAAEADKPVIVVFNQVDLSADFEYWPRWLDTFSRETGVEPEAVFVAPHDRRAADRLELPLYGVGTDGKQPIGEPADLRGELALLQFDAIKIRTFRGALRRVLDGQEGVAGYLAEVRRASAEFGAAAEALSTNEMARLDWPTLPPRVLVDEIRRWWDGTRSGWSRQVHAFYRTLGRGLAWPFRAARESMAPAPPADPLDDFRRREREAILLAVGKMLDELARLAEVGNETLRPRLKRLLGGRAREELLRRVGEAHRQLPAVDDDYRRFLHAELDAWRQANPRAVWLLQSLDRAWAVARPTITVALVVSSWGVAGGLVGQAGHAAGELATELALTGGLTGGGEALVSSTSEGVRHAAARMFSRLQARYAQRRAQWLADWLERELLGEVLGQLRRGAEAPSSDAFLELVQSMERLEKSMGQ